MNNHPLSQLNTTLLVLTLAGFTCPVSRAAEAQPHRLPLLPPARESTLRSERSDTPSVIQFINRTGAELQLIWLDFAGQRRPYGTIPPAETLRRTTYDTHAWLVADAAGKPVGLFVAEEKEAIAEIGTGANGPPSGSILAPPAAPLRTGRDVTFIVTSDSHYDAFENEDRNDRVRDTLRALNAVTNLHWPDELGGGAIEPPRGVMLLGDVIDDGDRVFLGKHQTPRQYYQFAADFGLDGTDGLLNYPVFETWGNHDGPPPGQEKFGFSFQARLKERNQRRRQKGWLTNLSTNGLHYSWDWSDVHLVMLGLYPADEQNPLVKRYSPVWHNPQGALTFLRDDLERHVGRSGRPVVLMSHCGFDTDWWHTNDWRAVYETARPYNVVLYLYGHSGTGLRKWAPDTQSPPFDCVNTGQTEKGFFVVQFHDKQLRLAYRLKRVKEEKLPDGKRRWSWDGTWEWRHRLEKEITADDRQSDGLRAERP
jgi:cytolysin (calcineurin-like family phosphatase)